MDVSFSLRAILRGSLSIGQEVLRLVLRRPVVGILAVPVDPAGRIVMMRRRDTGTWCLPGGMVEWGERLVEALRRELREETGWELGEVKRIIGIYSDPRRDPRLHAITILVEVTVGAAAEPRAAQAINPLEVIETRAFPPAELPTDLAFDTRRMLDDHLRGARAVLD